MRVITKAEFNRHVAGDPSWVQWAITVPLLAGHLAGVPGCLHVAIGLCGVMAAAMWSKVRSIQAMPVQVRLAYLALLLVGALPYMQWIYWVQLVGTSAMVLFGYCPLVRMLTLLPWNRHEAISRPWLSRLIFSSAPGGLWQWPVESPNAPACCSCSAFAADARTPQLWSPNCSVD